MCFTQKLCRAENAVVRSMHSGLPHLLRAGEGPVLFSAPHSVEQTRQGRTKPAEPQTAVLAELLHAETGCPILYKTAHCGDDANFDAVSPYKDALADYVSGRGVRFVIDLHQLAPARDVMVDIGTGGGKNGCTPAALNVFLRAFSARPLGVVPVLLALLSLSFLNRLRWWMSLLIIVVLVPVLLYLNLSARRSMRG